MDNFYSTRLSFCHNPTNKLHMAFCSKLRKAKWVHLSNKGKKKPDFNSLNTWLIRKYKKPLILLNENEIKKALEDFDKEIVREKFIKEILKMQ